MFDQSPVQSQTARSAPPAGAAPAAEEAAADAPSLAGAGASAAAAAPLMSHWAEGAAVQSRPGEAPVQMKPDEGAVQMVQVPSAGDMAAGWDEITSWTGSAAKWPAREAWRKFTQHAFSPISQKLIAHYMDRNGDDMKLSLADMRDINASFSIDQWGGFRSAHSTMGATARKTGKTQTRKIQQAKIAVDQCAPNTLGGFTVTLNGTLSVDRNGRFSFAGTAGYYDYWDFDVSYDKEAFLKQVGYRGAAGQAKTMIGNLTIPGKPYSIFGTAAYSEAAGKNGKLG